VDAEELSRRVREAGVIGAGGAGFPTYVKYQAKGIDTYLINGAECEPLLFVDQRLMERHADLLTRTARVVAEALGASRSLFGLKAKYHASVEALSAAGAEVHQMGAYYPAGDEILLIEDCLGRIVPEARLPLEVGVVVNNVETLYNVARAIEGIPVTETFVTVGGAVARPGVWAVPIGTDASELIAAAGGVTAEEPIFVDGGPMMGIYREDPHFPVSKTTKGLLVLERRSALARYEKMPVEHMIRQAKYACIQCSQCTVSCSRNLGGWGLEPHKIMRALAYANQTHPEILKSAFLCSECNLCSGLHACPMQLSPRRVNQLLKRTLREKGVKPDFPRRELKAHPQRSYRLVPSHRLEARLGLARYHRETPFLGLFETARVNIPTSQGLGAPAEPIVAAGDRVEKGQLIGRAKEGALSVPIHASISGVVRQATPKNVEIAAE
jgi:Na+-translocating ferredoxin:NAD+ oxidoreductase RnfC subunit